MTRMTLKSAPENTNQKTRRRKHKFLCVTIVPTITTAAKQKRHRKKKGLGIPSCLCLCLCGCGYVNMGVHLWDDVQDFWKMQTCLFRKTKREQHEREINEMLKCWNWSAIKKGKSMVVDEWEVLLLLLFLKKNIYMHVVLLSTGWTPRRETQCKKKKNHHFFSCYFSFDLYRLFLCPVWVLTIRSTLTSAPYRVTRELRASPHPVSPHCRREFAEHRNQVTRMLESQDKLCLNCVGCTYIKMFSIFDWISKTRNNKK